MPRQASTVFEAEVVGIEDLSPTFRRITLGGAGMEGYGFDHHPLDQRFKLIIPPGGGDPVFDAVAFLAENEEADGGWYQSWLRIPEDQRGSMRTYTVKRWRDAERELVVDMVLHIDEGGHSGPAAQWAIDAVPGSRLHLIGPRRGMSEGSRGAIEFERGNARELLLAGDETAVPAILNILDHLADLDEEGVPVRGRALLEVPCVDDELAVRAPDGVEVHWLPREGAEVGTLLEPAVHEAVAADAALLAEVRDARASDSSDDAREELPDVDVDQVILWEVPHVLTAAAHGSGTEVAEEDRPFYAWIAGEAGVIKRLRRYLVREVGVDRRQVAFMGYWRQGRAEN